MYVVIMAGGSGTRLWPLSRRSQPKQFQKMIGERSLIQETFERLRPIAEPREVFVSTTRDLADLCLEHLPELPAQNVLVEPVGRNTGPAVGYAAAFFERVAPTEVVATVHADHVIGRPERFVAALRLAAETVARSPERLMTIGLQPTWGNPGFGYIKAPGAVAGEQLRVVPVERFEEKPTPERAGAYVASGNYLWNAGYFVFRADTMMGRLATYDAALWEGLQRVQAAIGTPQAAAVLEREYPDFAATPIDQLVFEPESLAGRVMTIPCDLDWDDLGSWKTLRDVLARQGADNVCRGEVVAEETRNSLVYADGGRLVAVLGLDGVVVVDTPDALLVCAADRAEEIRAILARLAEDDPRR
ncbi:MAG: mannose-1-phosphate guanylyltransferase [Armatimonadetes bacterium]|nr:mannose-1-phosphate guanylyltransferase [Armatimonadota bacterium]